VHKNRVNRVLSKKSMRQASSDGRFLAIVTQLLELFQKFGAVGVLQY